MSASAAAGSFAAMETSLGRAGHSHLRLVAEVVAANLQGKVTIGLHDYLADRLLEAILLSLAGGLLGLGLAWAGTLAARAWLGLPTLVTPTAVALAVGISAGIGLFFGVAPAWRAARLDPIVALRDE